MSRLHKSPTLAIKLCLLASVLFLPTLALGAGDSPIDPEVKLITKTGEEKINDLEWSTEPVKTEVKPAFRDVDVAATFQAKFNRKDWTVLYRSDAITPGPDGTFKITAVVNGTKSEEAITAIGPMGEIERETFKVEVSNFKEVKKASLLPMSKSILIPSLGISFLNYHQSKPGYATVDFTQTYITAKLFYQYLMKPPRWDLGIAAFATAVPLKSSISGVSAYFIGLNARVGYVVPGIAQPWRLSLMFGAYYNTMFVSTGTFGYQNLYGPQLFPVVTHSLNEKNLLLAYAKYSPITNQLNVMSLTNREMAAGGSWTHMLANRKTVSLTIDYANLAFILNKITVTSKSLSLGVGYRW